MEIAVVYVVCFWQKHGMKNLIIKNLISHKVRNRRTAVMYAFSLGFIIFISVTYQLQITTASFS